MQIKRTATAGGLESNDVLVTVTPQEDTLQIEVESVVLAQFGQAIRQAALETAQSLGVTGAQIKLVDKGAVDSTIRARVETALRRAAEDTL